MIEDPGLGPEADLLSSNGCCHTSMLLGRASFKDMTATLAVWLGDMDLKIMVRRFVVRT